jgi:hypothetical protein
MSNETLLFICGIILALSAVTVCIVGLKVPAFPGKAAPLVVLWFAVFVVGSGTFAVLHAKDEDKTRAAESREADKKAEEEGNDVAPEGTEGAQGGGAEEAEEEVEGGQGLPEEGEVGPEEEPNEEATEGDEAGTEENSAGGESASAGG